MPKQVRTKEKLEIQGCRTTRAITRIFGSVLPIVLELCKVESSSGGRGPRDPTILSDLEPGRITEP